MIEGSRTSRFQHDHRPTTVSVHTVIAWFKTPSVQRGIQFLWIAVALAFLALYLQDHWQELRGYAWQPSGHCLALAVLFAIMRKALTGYQWGTICHYVLDSDGADDFRQNLKAYFVSNLASYIPGGPWITLGRVHLNSRRDIAPWSTVLCMISESMLLAVSAAFTAGLLVMHYFPDHALRIALAYVYFFVLAFVLTHPAVIRRILRIFHADDNRRDPVFRLRYRDMLRLLLIAIGCWFAGGVSHFWLLRALDGNVPVATLPLITAAFAVAWTAGYLTPLAPSGIGVRDGIMIYFFSQWIAAPAAVVAVLASRVLLTLEDIVASAAVARVALTNTRKPV